MAKLDNIHRLISRLTQYIITNCNIFLIFILRHQAFLLDASHVPPHATHIYRHRTPPPWDEVSICTSKAWDEASYFHWQEGKVDQRFRLQHRRWVVYLPPSMPLKTVWHRREFSSVLPRRWERATVADDGGRKRIGSDRTLPVVTRSCPYPTLAKRQDPCRRYDPSADDNTWMSPFWPTSRCNL